MQVGLGEIQNVQCEEKKDTGKSDARAKSCAQGDQKFKEMLDPKWNKRRGDLSARSYTAKFPTCIKELKERFRGGGNVHAQQGKV